jgi:hypothetical protein
MFLTGTFQKTIGGANQGTTINGDVCLVMDVESTSIDDTGLSRSGNRMLWAGLHWLLGLSAIATTIGFVQTQLTTGLLESTGMVRGWDFQQFYIAGLMPPDQLYDVAAFQTKQRKLFPVDDRNIPFLPLYPPMMASYIAPLSQMSYLPALAVWWSLSVLAYVLAARWMWDMVDAKWRHAVLLLMLGFLPFFVALRLGQLAPILLLILVAGLKFRSGLILSLLAVKPQYAVGLLVYLIIRRRWLLVWRMSIGIMLQVLATAIILGPQVMLDYLAFATVYLNHADLYVFPPGWVHSMAGLMGKTIHLCVIGLVALSCAMARETNWQKESALAVAFMLLFTPHLLLYDLVLMLVPIVYLLPNWRLSAAAAVATSALAIWPCAVLQVSFVPFVLLVILLTAGTNLFSTIKTCDYLRKGFPAVAH